MKKFTFENLFAVLFMRKKNSKTLFVGLCFVLLAFLYKSYNTDIKIDDKNFPDANFRKHLLAQDYGENGIITKEEMEMISEIDVHNCHISNLKGIQYFTNLKILFCWGNNLNAVRVEELINYLPDNPTKSFTEYDPGYYRKIYMFSSTSETEGNFCRKDQVVKLQEKGWNVYYWDGYDWLEYKGN